MSQETSAVIFDYTNSDIVFYNVPILRDMTKREQNMTDREKGDRVAPALTGIPELSSRNHNVKIDVPVCGTTTLNMGSKR